MNELINKLDEFLSEREEKEKYMIYGSIIIIFIIIYYYFNYRYLYTKVQEERAALVAVKKNYDITSYSRKLAIKRGEYLKLLKRIDVLQKDLKHINNLIVDMKQPKLIVNREEVFKYLKDVFQYSISKYVFPSYEINESRNNLVMYTISFKGRINLDRFSNLISFLRYMENNKFVSYFNRVEFNVSTYKKNRYSDFNGSFNIWSYK